MILFNKMFSLLKKQIFCTVFPKYKNESKQKSITNKKNLDECLLVTSRGMQVALRTKSNFTICICE